MATSGVTDTSTTVVVKPSADPFAGLPKSKQALVLTAYRVPHANIMHRDDRPPAPNARILLVVSDAAEHLPPPRPPNRSVPTFPAHSTHRAPERTTSDRVPNIHAPHTAQIQRYQRPTRVHSCPRQSLRRQPRPQLLRSGGPVRELCRPGCDEGPRLPELRRGDADQESGWTAGSVRGSVR
jgi:hypothetical protein